MNSRPYIFYIGIFYYVYAIKIPLRGNGPTCNLFYKVLHGRGLGGARYYSDSRKYTIDSNDIGESRILNRVPLPFVGFP